MSPAFQQRLRFILVVVAIVWIAGVANSSWFADLLDWLFPPASPPSLPPDTV